MNFHNLTYLCREWDSNPHAAFTQQEILSLWRLPFRHLGSFEDSSISVTLETWPGGEVVTQGTANPRRAGSIPALAS
ncbi:MAG: hypothetical protein JWN18_681, partial [Parcubacteria group bacterium]|nr:hypothetical protein [Parcubacteria group bacterium]